MSQTPSLTCTSLSFSWPDGTSVFDDLQIAFNGGRTGLVGVNGSGKSTLETDRRRTRAVRGSGAGHR